MKEEAKSKQYISCVLKWQKWKESGNGPRDRHDALAIIAREREIPLLEAENMARDLTDEDGELVAPNEKLSFIVWDLTENGARALDYDLYQNWLAGLLQQAGNFIFTYTRGSMKMGTRTVSVPTFVAQNGKVLNLGHQSRATFEMLANQFISYAKLSILRWKNIGVDPEQVRRTIRRLETEVMAEYEKDLVAAD